jgi:hypothetical protein
MTAIRIARPTIVRTSSLPADSPAAWEALTFGALLGSRPAYSAAIYTSLARRLTCSKRSSLTTAPARMISAIT